jgi:hypothetical protein
VLPELLAILAAAAPVGERTCSERVEPPRRDFVPSSRDVVLGRVVFLELRGINNRIGARPRDADMTMKVPVIVRAGAPVTVRIHERGRTSARLDFVRDGWNAPRRRVAEGAGQRAVRFVPCDPAQPAWTDGRPMGPWTGFNGGFLVARPGCAVLESGGVRRRVALAVPVRTCTARG